MGQAKSHGNGRRDIQAAAPITRRMCPPQAEAG